MSEKLAALLVVVGGVLVAFVIWDAVTSLVSVKE